MDPATAASAAAGGVVEDPILLASLVTREGQPEEGIARWALRAVFLLLLPAAAALWHLFVRGPGSVARGRALATAPLLPGGTLALATAVTPSPSPSPSPRCAAPCCDPAVQDPPQRRPDRAACPRLLRPLARAVAAGGDQRCAPIPTTHTLRPLRSSSQRNGADILSLRGIGAYPALRTLNVYNNSARRLRGGQAISTHSPPPPPARLVTPDLTSLRGIEACPNLHALDASNNDITDADAVGNLTNLRCDHARLAPMDCLPTRCTLLPHTHTHHFLSPQVAQPRLQQPAEPPPRPAALHRVP